MSRKTSHHIASIALFILYLCVLAYLCFGHPDHLLRKIPRTLWGLPFDKCVHFIMFFPFPFLSHEAFYWKNKWRAMVLSILCALAFCFAFELLQDKITTYRSTDPWDLSINVASVTIGSIIVAFINLFRKNR